jgi:hypothetical protein
VCISIPGRWEREKLCALECGSEATARKVKVAPGSFQAGDSSFLFPWGFQEPLPLLLTEVNVVPYVLPTHSQDLLVEEVCFSQFLLAW